MARGALSEATREIVAGLSAWEARPAGAAAGPFPAIALHWLRGLLFLAEACRAADGARGLEDEALASFERELADSGVAGDHIFARETGANTWYAIGACHLRRGDHDLARRAFDEATRRVPRHLMATAGLAILASDRRGDSRNLPDSLDGAVARAALLIADGNGAGAARLVSGAIAAAPPGHAGWTIPIDPLLGVQRDPATWAGVLTQLQLRAG